MKVLLLDRDGVLTEERPSDDYKPQNMAILPGVVEGLRPFREWTLFMVSNQSAVGRGKATREQVEACNEFVHSRLKKEGVELADIIYCPHRPDDNCNCRKPKTGMWDTLRTRHQLNDTTCVMVGNRESDMQFGKNIAAFTVYVRDPRHPLANERADLEINDLRGLAAHFFPHSA